MHKDTCKHTCSRALLHFLQLPPEKEASTVHRGAVEKSGALIQTPNSIWTPNSQTQPYGCMLTLTLAHIFVCFQPWSLQQLALRRLASVSSNRPPPSQPFRSIPRRIREVRPTVATPSLWMRHGSELMAPLEAK